MKIQTDYDAIQDLIRYRIWLDVYDVNTKHYTSGLIDTIWINLFDKIRIVSHQQINSAIDGQMKEEYEST
jgi:hypothetical protein